MNGIMTLGSKGAEMFAGAGRWFYASQVASGRLARAMRIGLVAMLALFGMSAMAQTDAGQVFDSALASSGASKILSRGLKIFGGFLVIGGIALAINGFTGRDEGYEKAVKIGIGILTLAIGIYFLTGDDPFGLLKMFA